MNKIKVAVFPAGTEIGLEINSALSNNKNIELIALTSETDHSYFLYDQIHFISDVKHENFINELNDFLIKENIDVLFPAHDLVLDLLELNSPKITKTCKIINHSRKTVNIVRNKELTYKTFPNISPKLIPKNGCQTFPIYVKPKMGFGGKDNHVVRNDYELKTFRRQKYTTNYVFCEYLPGLEYTVDCFTNRYGELQVCSPRTRSRIKNGIAVNSKIIPYNDLEFQKFIDIAKAINNELKFDGPWFFQVKRDADKNLKLLEIAPRVAGTSSLTRMSGYNVPLMSIYNAIGIDLNCLTQENVVRCVDRALTSKYELDFEYERIQIDLDDTLIIDNKVNAELMMLLYQCKNAGKKISLITRHKGDVFKTLWQYNIDRYLFNFIFIVDDGDKKSSFIDTDNNSIFIDDSFRERKDIVENCHNCKVFDVTEINCLLDWRK